MARLKKMPGNSAKYSSSKENYLKAIFHLEETNDIVTTTDVATELKTSPASVTDMLKKLKAQKLLLYERYKGFKLSQEGRRVAVQIIRKHRLWEHFLVEKLLFRWDEVHEIADELEHISSKQLIDRLDDFLEFPKTDPHGDPIPDSNGKWTSAKQVNLHELPLNKAAVVNSIGDQSASMLELLTHKHIIPGTKLEIRKRFAFDNSMELKIKNHSPITISEDVAKNVFVKYDD
jgi:DtxR family Mn-dependent transcriptional regulator